MSELTKTAATFRPKSGLRNGYGHVRCPNSGCEHILFEASKRFWFTNRIEQMICVQCDRPASLIACVQADADAGELIARYWYHRCEDGFEAGQKLVEIAEGRLVDPIHTKFVPKLVVRESA